MEACGVDLRKLFGDAKDEGCAGGPKVHPQEQPIGSLLERPPQLVWGEMFCGSGGFIDVPPSRVLLDISRCTVVDCTVR